MRFKKYTLTAKWRSVLIFFGLTVWAAVLYWPALRGEFVWDDLLLVRDNGFVHRFSHVPALLRGAISTAGATDVLFYRPLYLASFLVDHLLWCLNTFGYHVVNLLLHAGTAFGITVLVNQLFRKQMVSLFAGLLFLVHPVQTEAVAYVSGRADPLCAVLMIWGFVAYVKFCRHRKGGMLIVTVLCYAAALLSRENALAFPFLLLVYHHVFGIERRRRAAGWFVFVTVIYVMMRLIGIGALLSAFDGGWSLKDRLLGIPVMAAVDARYLIWPFPLHLEHGTVTVAPHVLRIAAGVLILSVLYVTARRGKKSGRLLGFACAWFLISFFFVSNFYPLGTPFAEHWLYVPSIAFCMMAALFLESAGRLRFKGRRILQFGAALVMIGVFSIQTRSQAGTWTDPMSLYGHTLNHAPTNARVYNNLGSYWRERGYHDQALKYYLKALKSDPDFAGAYDNLGIMYLEEGDVSLAVKMHLKAIVLDPNNADSIHHAGDALAAAGQHDRAKRFYEKALHINPHAANTYFQLGNLHMKTSDAKEALRAFDRAVRLNPYLADGFDKMGVAWTWLGETEKAEQAHLRAIRIDSKHRLARAHLKNILTSRAQKASDLLSK